MPYHYVIYIRCGYEPDGRVVRCGDSFGICFTFPLIHIAVWSSAVWMRRTCHLVHMMCLLRKRGVDRCGGSGTATDPFDWSLYLRLRDEREILWKMHSVDQGKGGGI
jgi:hypothetical protein